MWQGLQLTTNDITTRVYDNYRHNVYVHAQGKARQTGRHKDYSSSPFSDSVAEYELSDKFGFGLDDDDSDPSPFDDPLDIDSAVILTNTSERYLPTRPRRHPVMHATPQNTYSGYSASSRYTAALKGINTSMSNRTLQRVKIGERM